MEMKNGRVVLGLWVAALLSACTSEPPKCSAPSTVALVKQLILGDYADEFSNNLVLTVVRPTQHDAALKSIGCTATLTVTAAVNAEPTMVKAGDTRSLPITYESQLGDDGKQIVSLHNAEDTAVAVEWHLGRPFHNLEWCKAHGLEPLRWAQ